MGPPHLGIFVQHYDEEMQVFAGGFMKNALAAAGATRREAEQKFFGSFFQKRTSFLPPVLDQIDLQRHHRLIGKNHAAMAAAGEIFGQQHAAGAERVVGAASRPERIFSPVVLR
jgi:hypothetical protein